MVFLAVFPSLVAFIVSALWGRSIGYRAVCVLTIGAVLLSACASAVLFWDVLALSGARVFPLFPWIVSGDFHVQWALRLDTLSVVMLCVVNSVSACVHIYSVGYMQEDPARGRFMSYLSLFTFAMLALVTADNGLQLFFGWEAVGLASYLLIGFWNKKDSANAAAMKAFIVNRVGDFGLLMGLMGLFFVFGTLDFSTIFSQAAEKSAAQLSLWGLSFSTLDAVCLFLFMGAVGKSAQLGLHTWLPDAMEGPTPVSALIHAATMVTAGVFLIARLSPVFEYAPIALMVVTLFGASTAFVAATIGLTQFDIKRVIAYSTMSQLGYMFFALGVSAYSAAMFHLVTHAFFKALLFLGAGSVIHALSGEQDMRRMGGIWKTIPLTYGLMWIGSLALAGIPPFAGYFSKDIILESAWAADQWWGYTAYVLGVLGAFMTAFYSWRLLVLTFHGAPRAPKKIMKAVHESPPSMLIPLVVLAIGAVSAGFFFHDGFVGTEHGHAQKHGEKHALTHQDSTVKNSAPAVEEPATDRLASDKRSFSWNRDDFWKDSLFVLPAHDTVARAHDVPFLVKKVPLFAAFAGIVLAVIGYGFFPLWPGYLQKIFGPLHRLFYNKWYFDGLYERLFVRPAWRMGYLFWKKGDEAVIDYWGPEGSARGSQKIATLLRTIQSGYIYHYALVMMVAVIGMISWLFFRVFYGF